MPKVWNKRDWQTPSDAKYVGRPNLLGNPFSHLTHSIAKYRASCVEDAIQQFESYARRRMKQDPEFKAAIAACYNQDLVCWCVPKGGIDIFDTQFKLVCHAQIIGRLAKEIYDETHGVQVPTLNPIGNNTRSDIFGS